MVEELVRLRSPESENSPTRRPENLAVWFHSAAATKGLTALVPASLRGMPPRSTPQTSPVLRTEAIGASPLTRATYPARPATVSGRVYVAVPPEFRTFGKERDPPQRAIFRYGAKCGSVTSRTGEDAMLRRTAIWLARRVFRCMTGPLSVLRLSHVVLLCAKQHRGRCLRALQRGIDAEVALSEALAEKQILLNLDLFASTVRRNFPDAPQVGRKLIQSKLRDAMPKLAGSKRKRRASPRGQSR